MIPTPTTLLDISGASRTETDIANAAVILIDPQREYDTGVLRLSGMDAAVEGAGRLLDAARSAAIPVIHVLHHGRPGAAAFDPDRAFVQPIAGLEPRKAETVFIKGLPNGFAGTGLRDHLISLGKTEVIVAGFATHMCVSSTVRAALDLGFACTVVANATATRDLWDPASNQVVPAAQVQAANLAALADRFARIVPDTAALFRASAAIAR